MSASFQFSESNGAGQVITDGISNVNFGSNDSPNLNTITYPITRGQNSFSKYIRAKFTGTWTTISNMLFWRSDVLGYKTGETLKASANATYGTPSQTSTGDSNIPLNVSGDPALAINSAEGAATIVYGASGVSGYSGYIRLQEQSTGSTPAGAGFQKTLTFQYDEV
jgi:hypothetical protein